MNFSTNSGKDNNQNITDMNNTSKKLLTHAFILDILCLVLCLALLFLGTKNIISYWMLAIGAIIALVALVTSIALFIKARKIDRDESRRIEQEILDNAAKEDAVEATTAQDDLENKQDDYKNDDAEE